MTTRTCVPGVPLVDNGTAVVGAMLECTQYWSHKEKLAMILLLLLLPSDRVIKRPLN